MNANFFCWRIVRTQPLTVTVSPIIPEPPSSSLATRSRSWLTEAEVADVAMLVMRAHGTRAANADGLPVSSDRAAKRGTSCSRTMRRSMHAEVSSVACFALKVR